MKKTLAPAILVIAAWLCAPLESQAVKKCYDCKGTGLIVCQSKACKQEKVCGTKAEHRCDTIWGAECCRGTQKILCPKCKDPVVQTELQTELDTRKAWVDQMRKVDQGSQTRFSHIETDHWILHSSLPVWKIKINENEVTLTRVRAAHVWSERLEATSTFVEKVLGKYPAQKQTACLVQTPNEMMRATLTIQGVGHSRPFKTFGPAGKFTTGPHDEFRADEHMHPHVVHNAAHLLINSTFGYHQNFMQSWFNEAFAHWVELENFKRQTTFCFNEVGKNKDPLLLADWKKYIYGEVASRKDESLAMIGTRDTDRQSVRDWAHGWAFVEYLTETQKPEDFRKFAQIMSETGGDTKKAMDAAYGWSTAAFQEKWRAHVVKFWAP